jgi:excisionase family DNA binding protein
VSAHNVSPTSIAAAAERLGVCTKTVRRWIAEGRLTGYRVGPTLIRLDAAEVDALLRPIPTAGHLS